MKTNKKTIAVVVFVCILALVLLLIHWNILIPRKSASIQTLINEAEEGSVIKIPPGVYKENVIINKPVILVGESKETTIIDAGGNGTVISIKNVNHVSISGFTIRNSCPSCYGVFVKNSSNCVILDIKVVNNGRGIYLDRCRDGMVRDNVVTGNNQGINLVLCENITLRNNTLKGNKYNLAVLGNHLSMFFHDIDTTNTVDGKKVYYWVNERDKQIPLDAGYVGIVNSSNIVVKDLTLTGNYQGLLLAGTRFSTLENLIISDNMEGIYLLDSHHNVVRNCTITKHREYGILLSSSKNNLICNNKIFEIIGTHGDETGAGIMFESHDTTANEIVNNTISNNDVGVAALFGGANVLYHNNFIDNTAQVAFSALSKNTWDNGVEGNYWSDYAGEDLNDDGIGDTPYVIDSDDQDRYPLMNPFIP